MIRIIKRELDWHCVEHVIKIRRSSLSWENNNEIANATVFVCGGERLKETIQALIFDFQECTKGLQSDYRINYVTYRYIIQND